MKHIILSLCILITLIAILVTSVSMDTLNYELSPQDNEPEDHEHTPTAGGFPYQPNYQETDVGEVPSGDYSMKKIQDQSFKFNMLFYTFNLI
ncbi:hypothetical protein F8M41_020976 [Gigaspora margarita]|uniref:Uncharacterized protein n=1 Tax=Gigaspora margarita TaxID=4874 RepID=A0A8H4EJF3_GIGMA|nr:hypothetical protein F8M41_020976 [Gigaspora margarita]